MYHCHIQFYLAGVHNAVFEAIREMTPPEHFTYSFWESDEAALQTAAQADALFICLQGMDAAKTLQDILSCKKREAELILLADREQSADLPESMEGIEDIWILPMRHREAAFRFQNWQRHFKRKVDLWQSTHFMDICINSSPNLIWFKDKEGVHEIVNESFCRVVNKTKEQVAGRRHAYIWDVEQDDPVCMESELEVMRKKETCVAREFVRTGDGERTLKTYKSPLYDWDGSVMGTVGVAVDVTKEEAYRQQVLEKNQTLEMLFSTMDCGVMYHSMDGSHLISINRAALRLLDYASQEELVADGFKLIARTVMDEDKEKLRECINSLKKPGDSVNVEYRVQHRNGKVLYILGNIKLIEEGGELYYQRFLLDFTAHKLKDEQKWAKKNQEMQYQEQIFGMFATFLSDNIDDIYMMLDEEGGKAEFVSTNIERVLGIPWQDVMDNVGRLGRAGYITGKEISRKDLAALKPGMSLEQMETERIHQVTGEPKWFRESVYCVWVQGTKKIVVYISDRTKEKQIQNTLSEALNIAQTANKAKSTFLGNVSHDIRTPMNAIIGFIPLLQEEADHPEHVREYTQKISAASQHLLGLINDVLDINKIESGSTVLNISELNLRQVVEEINTIIRPQANAKQQEFEISMVSLTNERLLGDKLRINQILINILSNAVKYTPEGGHIRMVVDELHQVDKSYSRIRFTVSDDGQGMSEEYQKVLFEPFSREQTAAWNKTQGTGLGMTITKSLIDLMQGSIKVKSRLGEGTTFVVELELRNPNREDDPEDVCRDIAEKMAGTGVEVNYTTNGGEKKMLRGNDKNMLSGRHVLIVEDIDINQMVLVKLLGTLGAECDIAENGQEAVEQYVNSPAGRYDVILMDIQMPVMNGYDAAKAIRASAVPGAETVPIIAMSANAFVDDVRKALDAGMNAHVSKPIIFEEFKNTLREVLEIK